MSQHVHAGHRQRVKKRFVQSGFDDFDDHQVLELLLFYAIPMKDTNELAHSILQEFGSLSNLFEATPEEICARCSLTEHAAILLSMVPPLSKRYNLDRWREKPTINKSALAGEYARSLFTGKKYECFYLISLNSQNKVNHASLVHEGTINESPVYPRILVETALRHKAHNVILAHNHPGGSLKPSSADLAVTQKITEALSAISINVVDHIIACGDSYYSFAENNLL
ncbi:MAG TPA: hypothetical protein DHN33_06845 [Eubacteriaceae bacterium]|nr:hypothetical protein [Eubacteriaceae bacterium]